MKFEQDEIPNEKYYKINNLHTHLTKKNMNAKHSTANKRDSP